MIKKDDTGATVDQEVRIDAPVDAVWRAITDPEQIRRWFPLDARGDASAVGGRVEVTWGGDSWWGLRVARAEPNRHLRLQDADPPAEGQPVLFVDFHLERDGESTVVRLVHSGFGPGDGWDDYLDGLDTGWGYFVRNLKIYLEMHRDVPRTMVWARPSVKGSRADIWTAVLEVYGVDEATLEGTAGAPSVTLAGEKHPGVLEIAVPGRALAVRLPDLGESILFVEIESEGEKARVGIWLSTYGMEAAGVSRLQSAVDDSGRTLSNRLEAA